MICTPPGDSLISPVRVDNLPWNLFKREIESQAISQLYPIATRSQNSVTGGPNASELHAFNYSYLTTFGSPTPPSAAIYAFDQANLSSADQLNTDLWDWIIMNDFTSRSISDMALSTASPGTYQRLMNTPSDAIASSDQPALSLLSRFSERHILDLPSFFRRYTTDEQDLELDALSFSISIPTNHAALFRFFCSFTFLITNNILIDYDIHELFTWIVQNNCVWVIAKILELPPTGTVDVLANRIFPAAVRAGEIMLVRKLIAHGVDVHCQKKWETPLSLAVQRRDIEMVSLLCECGVKPAVLQFSVLKSDQNNDTLWSDRNNQLLSLLLERGADPDSFIYNRPSGYPLVSAAAEGEVRAVGLLLSTNARTDLAIPEVGTALQAAAASGHKAVVRSLAEAGANVNAVSVPNIQRSHHASLRFFAAFMTPIQLAAHGNREGIVQILIQSGALVNYLPITPHLGLRGIEEMFPDWSRKHHNAIPLAYPIQCADMNNNMALVQQLLAAGAYVDSRVGTNYGDTPLQIAARIGNIEMAKMLLSHNADVNAPPGKYEGRTAIQAAAGNGNMGMMQMLISVGADINAAAGWRKGRTAVQAAMEEGHHDLAILLLHLGADINASPAFSGGLTALQAAAVSGNIELLKTALSKGADVKGMVSPEDGVTALQAVIKRKDISALNVMLPAGVDVNELSPSKASDRYRFDEIEGANMTSLQLAAYYQWTEGANILINFGAEVDVLPPQPGIDALTALGWAIDNYDHDMMELLLHNGADPNAPAMNDRDVPSAFLYALYRYCPNEMFDLFLQRGADITKCWGSESAIELAASSTTNDISIVKRVIEVSSQLAGWSDSVQKALASIAVDIEFPPNAELVKILLDAGANFNAIDAETGETLLQKTLLEPDVDVVKLLLESEAEVNLPATLDKGTPLQTAILYKKPEIANILIDYGADVNALPAGKQGATALQAAAIHGYIGLAKRLLELGADVAAAAAPVDGRTAIDGAAEHGRLDMLQLLLNSYPSREDIPLACNRAAPFAEKEGHTEIAAWLRAYALC